MSSLLSIGDQPAPLEFLINGEKLRTSLEDFITRHSISAETTLRIEYARAILPPAYRASFPHDDPIGSVDVLSSTCGAATWQGTSIVRKGHERILTASHDGCVRVWSPSGQVLASSVGAEAPDEHGNRRMPDGRIPILNTTRFLSPTSVVASGWPFYLRIWDYSEDEYSAPTADSASLIPKMDLHGHRGCVRNVDVHHAAQQILSASDDCTAMLWSCDPDDKSCPPPNSALIPRANDNAPSAKRRKLCGTSNPGSSPIARGPIATLPAHPKKSPHQGHDRPVNTAIFASHDRTVAYTASDDYTVMTWDLTTSKRVSSRTPEMHENLRSLIGTPAVGSSVVATGSGRGKIYIVDLREDAKTTYARVLKGHKNAVVTLDTDPARPWMLCSGSHDGCVRGWDLRQEGRAAGVEAGAASGQRGREMSSAFRIPREWSRECDRIVGGEGVMVWSVCWDADVGIVSAGVDRTLQINR